MKYRIYLNGTMVAFATEAGAPLASHPPGRLIIEPLATGFSFLDADSDKIIFQVANFADVLDKAGAPLGASFEDTLAALNVFFGVQSSAISPAGVNVIEGQYFAETTTLIGDTMILYTVDAAINQVIYIEARSLCGKDGITGHAIRFAGRAVSVNAVAKTLSASTGPDPSITTSFLNPVLAISTSGNDILIQLTNGTQDTSWYVSYSITIFELP
jgi:hypothetical protein